MNLVYSSRALKPCRAALEELLFFNPRQYRVREGIVALQEKFGPLRLEETDDRLCVRVGNCEAQTLFVYDPVQHRGDPVGVVVFLRTSSAEVAIMHLAVHPDYSLQGEQAGLGLGIMLVEKVKEIASQIDGIKRIVFLYQRELVMRL